jgi:nitroimidazol reductase NimA-like FMN-containing flavoprotein (pyridoxamine 5'-phosphate oxidase superfamily)
MRGETQGQRRGPTALDRSPDGHHACPMEIDRHGLEVLTRAECLHLLEGGGIGRVVVTDKALPAAFPVNFFLLDDDVVFLTAEGSKLDAAGAEEVVAFEVDEIDPQHHCGWSVLIQGWARVVDDATELHRVRALPLQPWVPGDRTTAVRIRSVLVSGRRLLPRDAAARPVVVPDWDTPVAADIEFPGATACPRCGCDELSPVSVGNVRNFVCNSCAACWHVANGNLRRVLPQQCPGCAFRPMCTAAAVRDDVLAGAHTGM